MGAVYVPLAEPSAQKYQQRSAQGGPIGLPDEYQNQFLRSADPQLPPGHPEGRVAIE